VTGRHPRWLDKVPLLLAQSLSAMAVVGLIGGVAGYYTNQYPSALDTPLQNTYGSLQSTTEFDLSAAGAFTCNVAGWYKLLWNLRFGRTSGTGTAQIIWRVLFNGLQIGKTIAGSVGGATDTFPFSLAASIPFAVGDVLTTEIMRDSSGNDDGGLLTLTPAVGSWEKSASCSLRIDKEVVVL